MVLQGKEDVSKIEENTNLSEINSKITANDNSDVTMNDMPQDKHILDTLDNTKNPTSDIYLDNNIFESVADVDISLHPATSMNIDDPSLPLTENEPHIERNNWNHNSLSINNESDCMNHLIKADTNLNQINTESNSLHTPLSAPSDSKLISTSTDLAPLSEAITPSSLGMPLVSPVETIPQDVPLTESLAEDASLEIQPEKELKQMSPVKPVSPPPPPPPSAIIPKSPVPMPPLTSGYELPRICLLLNENEFPSPPTRPPQVPVAQLYPPTPSITVC